MPTALLYALLGTGVAAFQIGLALGMPWGALAMGGAWPGTLPAEMRVAAGVAAGVHLALVALVVQTARGRIARRWLWPLALLLAFGFAMNLAAPSAAERALWAPYVAVMLICVIRLARRP